MQLPIAATTCTSGVQRCTFRYPVLLLRACRCTPCLCMGTGCCLTTGRVSHPLQLCWTVHAASTSLAMVFVQSVEAVIAFLMRGCVPTRSIAPTQALAMRTETRCQTDRTQPSQSIAIAQRSTCAWCTLQAHHDGAGLVQNGPVTKHRD